MSGKGRDRRLHQRLDVLERAMGLKGEGIEKTLEQRVAALEFAVSEASLSMAALLRLFVMEQGEAAMQAFDRAKALERRILAGDVGEEDDGVVFDEPDVAELGATNTEPSPIIPVGDGGIPEGASVFGG